MSPPPEIAPPQAPAETPPDHYVEAKPAPAARAWRNDSRVIGGEPFSTHASNIVPGDTRSVIAPRLPAPAVEDDASPERLLSAAVDALQKARTGLAQEALERAETRLLDRATNPSAANQPDNSARIEEITQALRALGHGDLPKAQEADQ